MAFELTEIKISGLHGRLNISIPVRDNLIILVGANGLGKTTVVNLLYFFLTKQWSRLQQYQFDEISIRIKGSRASFALRRDQLSYFNWQSAILGSSFTSRFPSSTLQRVLTHDFPMQDLIHATSYAEVSKIARSFKLPMSIVSELRQWTRSQFLESSEGLTNHEVRDLAQRLEAAVTAEILYLPTYRRIEQDLRAVFSGYSERTLQETEESLEFLNSGRGGFIELVQFGMEDVEEKISKVLQTLRERSRAELNNLAGSYLRDVIRRSAGSYDSDVIDQLSELDIAKILGRVEERALNEADKQNLRKVINKIKQKGNLRSEDKYLAHYFSKLVDIYHNQQMLEQPIRRFVDICNKYLDGKRIVYDELNYEISINTSNNSSIKMKHLSSGEKQVVSLLAQIYLGGSSNDYLVIIDEPELSLSVEWQKTLLPDIWGSGHCKLMVAVTHSPFIFDNELEEYAKDLSECIKVAK